MGIPKLSGSKTNMKLVLLVTALISIIQAKNEILTKEEANARLLLPDGRTRRAAKGLFGKSVKSVKKKWNEFKDDVEETNLPEKEVDNLERCTFWCKTRDHGKDLLGNAYEEKREDQEENGTPFVAACPKCFEKVPKSGNFKFPKIVKGKKCVNSKAGIFG